MVFASTRPTGTKAAEVARRLAEAGVLALDESPWLLRFVTHLDVDDAGVEEAGEIVVRTMSAMA